LIYTLDGSGLSGSLLPVLSVVVSIQGVASNTGIHWVKHLADYTKLSRHIESDADE